MPEAFRISQAASLALHAMALLASRRGGTLSTGEMARRLGASEAHLSKVLQRLLRAGLLASSRGPKGGFSFPKGDEGVSLLEVYECIEGPFEPQECLLGEPACGGRECVLGRVLERVNRDVRDYLARTRVGDLDGVFANGRRR